MEINARYFLEYKKKIVQEFSRNSTSSANPVMCQSIKKCKIFVE